MTPSVGIVIPTLNGAQQLPHCIPPLLASSYRPHLLVVDSSSDDATVSVAENLGASTLVIPRGVFNHGATRELARRMLNTEIIVMVTQDAYASGPEALDRLIAPILEGKASASYGRQLPHSGADFFESFHRFFNYPQSSELRTFADLPLYGKQLFFFSNSFGAYHNRALEAVGGFAPARFGEDTVAVAKLLRAGYSIAYVADAIVHHSHSYSLLQEFQRHKEIGYCRYEQRELLAAPTGDNARGRKYAQKLLQGVLREVPFNFPYACALLGVKWLGYQIGQLRAMCCRSQSMAKEASKNNSDY